MLATATRFPKLRRAARIAAFVFPLGMFVSFLLFAAGMFLWAVISSTLSMFAIVVLATFLQLNAGSSPKESIIRWLPGRIASSLVFFWLLFRTDVFRLVEKIIDNHVLWDWRLIAAASIWTASGILSLLRKIGETTDEEIFHRLNEGSQDT